MPRYALPFLMLALAACQSVSTGEQAGPRDSFDGTWVLHGESCEKRLTLHGGRVVWYAPDRVGHAIQRAPTAELAGDSVLLRFAARGCDYVLELRQQGDGSLRGWMERHDQGRIPSEWSMECVTLVRDVPGGERPFAPRDVPPGEDGWDDVFELPRVATF